MNEKDYDELFSTVKNGARDAFNKIRSNHVGEKISSFALYSDNDALTICTTACTQSRFEQIEDWIYFEEWDCEWEEIECLDKSSSVLSRINEAFNNALDSTPEDMQEELWEKHTIRVFTTFVEALKSLINEGAFGTEEDRNELFINFDISDSGIEEETHKLWTQQLNTVSMFNRYARKA